MNTIVTFLVSGIWHGGGYLLWGLLHGIFVSWGEKFRTGSKTLNRVATFLVVSFLWSFSVILGDKAALLQIRHIFRLKKPGNQQERYTKENYYRSCGQNCFGGQLFVVVFYLAGHGYRTADGSLCVYRL